MAGLFLLMAASYGLHRRGGRGRAYLLGVAAHALNNGVAVGAMWLVESGRAG